MNTGIIIRVALGICLSLVAAGAISSDIVKKVIAEEITGVVMDAGTGKPIPNAIVAIRFERFNTGHSSPACFRAVAAETDANGRFRFEPWVQENTLASNLLGEFVVYKKGYVSPLKGFEHIKPVKRTFLGFRMSDDLNVARTERRLEVGGWSGSETDRMEMLLRLVSRFSCRVIEPSIINLLVAGVRQEILESPLANERVSSSPSGGFTYRSWIESRGQSF